MVVLVLRGDTVVIEEEEEKEVKVGFLGEGGRRLGAGSWVLGWAVRAWLFWLGLREDGRGDDGGQMGVRRWLGQEG
ncbi:hypothetical protein PVK06_001686 [Gossypium arboreum]|uniref:Uncharacterized protein n=1 Tax=Gossypium arboreum TaxID=29729 RepID=A0ABR0R2Q9_GOSAR|nr:hypothetical protein PVK06_001686 [Gossypium arboreum]